MFAVRGALYMTAFGNWKNHFALNWSTFVPTTPSSRPQPNQRIQLHATYPSPVPNQTVEVAVRQVPQQADGDRGRDQGTPPRGQGGRARAAPGSGAFAQGTFARPCRAVSGGVEGPGEPGQGAGGREPPAAQGPGASGEPQGDDPHAERRDSPAQWRTEAAGSREENPRVGVRDLRGGCAAFHALRCGEGGGATGANACINGGVHTRP